MAFGRGFFGGGVFGRGQVVTYTIGSLELFNDLPASAKSTVASNYLTEALFKAANPTPSPSIVVEVLDEDIPVGTLIGYTLYYNWANSVINYYSYVKSYQYN